MTTNVKLQNWVDEIAKMTQPDAIRWIEGTEAEKQELLDAMVASGMATKLNEAKHPGCYLFRSDPSDVARVEGRTYIASKSEDDAGPTNNWIDPVEL
ncbi:MAG: phosphoenolpyruvate carboxykinase, partial [Clostridiales bacterium]|nr:phosphoenolpyruvate carboxykinase [Clostridiales bacterium]